MTDKTRTEEPIHSAKVQLENAALVRSLLEDGHQRSPEYYQRYFHPKARIWADSRPSADNPVVWENDQVFIGPEGMKRMSEAYANRGYTYKIVVHDIYACGPVVVVNRTDIRKEAGKPDWPIPATGVFALKDGKIIEWSDYFR